MVKRIADFINTSTRNFQMKHCPCLRYAMIYRPTCKIPIPENVAGRID